MNSQRFSLYGTVNTVTMVTDKRAGGSKGYGFVKMTDDDGTERAIRPSTGTRIGRRTIIVRYADDKQPASNPSAMSSPGAFNYNCEKENIEHRKNPGPKRPRRPI